MTLAKHYRRKPAPKQREFLRLDEAGREDLDQHSLVAEIMFRPPTLAEQIQRLNEAGKIHRWLPDDDLADDDFGDDLDDIPDEGLTLHELAALPKASEKLAKRGKDPHATPTPDSSGTPPVAPNTQAGGVPDEPEARN